MRGWVESLGVGLLVVLIGVSLGGPLAFPPGIPVPTATVRVDEGTDVTIWERTTDLNELNYDVPTLLGPGGTFDSLASEHYTFTSDGVSLRIHCFRPTFANGTSTGNNIAAARLNGVPGHPGGLYATGIVSYIVGYGGIESSRFKALGTNLSDHTFMGDQDSELVLEFTVENNPPVITSFVASVADEAEPVTYEVVAEDADGQPLTYDYDFDGDGTWDLSGAGNTSTHVFGDDFEGTAKVRVSDGLDSAEASASVLVGNVAPRLDSTDFRSTHLGECDDEEDDDEDEEDKEAHEPDSSGAIDEDEEDDDEEDDDEACAFAVFRAMATDPGSDDLTFTWDFGDGTTVARTYFNDGSAPDPYPSPGGTFPVIVTNETTHVYDHTGTFTVTITVADDDGGTTTFVGSVVVCSEDDDCEDEDDDDEDESDEDRGRDDEDEPSP